MEAPHITTSQRKLAASLRTARGRRENSLFLAEGTRCVSEILRAFTCRWLIATDAWLSENREMAARMPVLKARPDELERISSLQTPQGVIAVCEIPASSGNTGLGSEELILALDTVQDPGNLGTIVRVADWFGIRRIWASEDTVDIYNPKVVQATMGGIARVDIEYCRLPERLGEARRAGMNVYGTFLDGSDIYATALSTGGVIVMGNEGSGISPETAALCNRRIRIPSFPTGVSTVESLNVATATAITVAEFRRQTLAKN